MKLTFAILVLIACTGSVFSQRYFAIAPARAEEPCAVGEVTIRSRTLNGQIVLHDRGRIKPASGAFVEMFVFRDGDWHLYTRVSPVNEEARFTLLEVDRGRYYVVAKFDGFKSSKLHLSFKKGNAEQEVVIPLSNERCVNARTQGVKH